MAYGVPIRVTMSNFVKIDQAVAILPFFKMAAVAILDFQNFKFLTADYA